jgi:hypothetical protein
MITHTHYNGGFVREDEDEQVQRMRELGEKIEFLFITME